MVSRVSPADFLSACSTQSLDSIKKLIDSQADLTVITDHGNTCLHLAAQRKDSSLLQLLQDKTPELANQQNHSGNTPFDCYLQSDSSSRVPSILNKFIEISILDNCNQYGNTIFQDLVWTPYLEIAVNRCWTHLTGVKNNLPSFLPVPPLQDLVISFLNPLNSQSLFSRDIPLHSAIASQDPARVALLRDKTDLSLISKKGTSLRAELKEFDQKFSALELSNHSGDQKSNCSSLNEADIGY